MKEITKTESISIKRYAAKVGETILIQDSTGEVASFQTCAKDASITLPANGRLFVGTKAELDQKIKVEKLIIKTERLQAEAKAKNEVQRETLRKDRQQVEGK